MNICVLGGGMQGRVAAFDLAGSGHLVTVIDIDRSNLERLRGAPSIKPLRFAASAFPGPESLAVSADQAG